MQPVILRDLARELVEEVAIGDHVGGGSDMDDAVHVDAVFYFGLVKALATMVDDLVTRRREEVFSLLHRIAGEALHLPDREEGLLDHVADVGIGDPPPAKEVDEARAHVRVGDEGFARVGRLFGCLCLPRRRRAGGAGRDEPFHG